MKELFKEYLFTKHVLVATTEPSAEESFNTIVALANKLGINITKGIKYASQDMIEYAANQLGEYIPAPFYRGFPDTVRQLTKDQLLFDQLFHYFQTYGCGNFDETGHSVFEQDFTRLAFNENVTHKDFEILTEAEAAVRLNELICGLLESSRPLSEGSYEIVREAIKEYEISPKDIPCKQTAVRLLYDTKNVARYGRFLNLSDVIKLVDYINYRIYGNENLKKLNFKNQDRKLITKVIDLCFSRNCNVKDCFEKRKIWCGLLHHIHYKAKNDKAMSFLRLIRSNENISAYSFAEKAIADGDIVGAAKILYEEKGSSVVIRNLNYLLSRCKSEEDVKGVLSWVK